MKDPEITSASRARSSRVFLLVGGYTADRERGVIVYLFNDQTGEITPFSESESLLNPSYLYADKTGHYVYAVSEQEKNGEVYAFSFNEDKGGLFFLNKQRTEGDAPCFVYGNSRQDHLFVANYGSGSLTVIPVNKSGFLSAPGQQLQNIGKSADPERQDGPHVHTAVLSPDEKHLLYTDLGTDQIYVSRYHPELDTPLEQLSVTNIKPGSGPRHLEFSKDGNHVYVVTELSGDVLVYEHSAGQLHLKQTISMLDPGFEGKAGGGALKLSANGLQLYVSDRGDANEIVVYTIDESNGLLTLFQRQNCMGVSPRDLLIDPSGRFLLVANQESNSVVVFKLDSLTGAIGEVVTITTTDQPSCLKFLK